MYFCNSCKRTFDEPDDNSWYEDAAGAPCRMDDDGCPYCGSSDYDKVHQCALCKEETAVGDDDLCKKCKLYTVKDFQRQMDEYTAEQREYLNDYYEGEKF